MLELRKRSLFSDKYIVEENGVTVAKLSGTFWSDQSEITVEGKRLRLKKLGISKDKFILFDDDTPLVEVEQLSTLRSKFVFNCAGRSFKIYSKAWYSSTLFVECEGAVVGRMRRRDIFSDVAIAELPDDLSIAIRIIIAWITLARWAASIEGVAIVGWR
jgi:hypothetical protein